MSLRAEAVTVRGEGGALLLDGVALAVEAGEVLALLGPNGAGKSTLLRVLSGELRPAAGAVALDGRPLAEWARRERARRLGVLPQASRLSFPFSALEVALLGRMPHVQGRETARDLDLARSALRKTGVEHLAGRSYLELSGGEQQRVQLARVLAQIGDPAGAGDGPAQASPARLRAARYLLLDEPTSSLDLRHQHALLGLARELARDGVGVLVSLHDLGLALRYADRAALLCEGRLLAAGPPRQVLSAERIRDVFGAEAALAHAHGSAVAAP